MAFQITDLKVGTPSLATTSTTQGVPLGTVVKGVDPTYGEGQFIYLKGVASTAVGDAVVYDNNAATTTRAVAASRGPVGIAMSANVASQYGWYQISGVASVTTTAATQGSTLAVTATAGQLTNSTASGQKVDGAVALTATASTKSLVQLAFPAANGNT